jgi:hypothetical protein
VADLGLVLELGDEEPVGEIDRPDRELRGHERHAELVHRPEEAAVKFQSQLVAAVADEREVDDERADPVADDDAHRALVVVDDEQDRRCDGDEQVRERRRGEEDRPLLDAEQRRQLLVVQLRPEADEGGADEPRLAVSEREDVRDRLRSDAPGGEPERRARHREPERGADDPHAMRDLGRVEVEAEERARDAQAKQDDQDGGQRRQRLDAPVVAAVQVARVERQQQNREDAGDEAA